MESITDMTVTRISRNLRQKFALSTRSSEFHRVIEAGAPVAVSHRRFTTAEIGEGDTYKDLLYLFLARAIEWNVEV